VRIGGHKKKYAYYLNYCAQFAGGDPVVQYHLGYIYYWGLTGQTSYLQAASYYQKAAQLGNMYAQYNLGMMYLVGQGVPKDPEHGAWWLEKAADQGYANAQKTLSELYKRGLGVPKNLKKAQELKDTSQINLNLNIPDDKPAPTNAETLYCKIRQDATTYLTFNNWFCNKEDTLKSLFAY